MVEVRQLIAAVRAVATGDDPDVIRRHVDALAKGTDEFAARRMDRSVRMALSGKTLDQVS
ncbi:MAG: molecular chaperone HscA [Burkholderiaceae bacterium]